MFADGKRERKFKCILADDTSYTITNVDDTFIDKNFINGPFISGSTTFELPSDAVVNKSTATITTSSEIKLEKNVEKQLKTTGTRTILIVRIVASDGATTSDTATLGDSVFGYNGNPVNIKSQFDACSHGGLIMEECPDLNSIDSRPNIVSGTVTVNVPTSVSDGDSAMENAVTTELGSQFGTSASNLADHVMYCFPTGTMSYVGYGYINSWLTAYDDRWCERVSSQMHEIGHNLGLAHSNENGEYEDQSGMVSCSL